MLARYTKLLATLGLLVLTGCGVKMVPNDVMSVAKTESFYASAPAYRIGADDLVEVNVWQNPALTVSVPVRPDGKITVPLIGDVQAGGKTPMEVAAAIRTALVQFIREPQVTVILTNLKSNEFVSRIRVTGAVQKPASMPFRQGMTVLDAILEAGGVNAFASPDQSKLYRKTDEKTSQYDVLLGQILNAGKLETNYNLIPGDIITVPERLF